jgi:plastocyanin
MQKIMILIVAVVMVVVVAGGLFFINPTYIQQTTKVVHVSVVKGSWDASKVKDGFQPKNISIAIGVNNTVTWTNDDDVVHTVHSDLPEFDSLFLDPGKSFTHTFTRPGTYTYHCDPHPWMVGRIIVKNNSSS